jgi:hypothetical protein
MRAALLVEVPRNEPTAHPMPCLLLDGSLNLGDWTFLAPFSSPRPSHRENCARGRMRELFFPVRTSE